MKVYLIYEQLTFVLHYRTHGCLWTKFSIHDDLGFLCFPVTKNGSINNSFMHTLIKAICNI